MNNKVAEQGWVREQVEKYKAVQGRYEQLAGVLEKVLRSIVKKYAHEAIVQVRAKAISSFAEKTLRKPTPKKDPVTDSLTFAEAASLRRPPLSVGNLQVHENNFVIDWENSIDVSQRHKPSEFGYRSVHYIVNFKTIYFPRRTCP